MAVFCLLLLVVIIIRGAWWLSMTTAVQHLALTTSLRALILLTNAHGLGLSEISILFGQWKPILQS